MSSRASASSNPPAPTGTHPENNLFDEFIALVNPTEQPINLWTSAGSWRIAGGVDFEGFVEHFSADEDEYGESDPVVEVGYEISKTQSRQRADNRHDGLEGAEEKSDSECVVDFQVLIGCAGCDGDGKGVHCQAESYNYDCD